MKKVIALCLIATVPGAVFAQAKKATDNSGYSKTPNGLEYKILHDATGGKSPAVGDYIEVHIRTSVNDSVLFDSRKMNNNQPVPFQLQAPSFKGDLPEGLVMLTPGDSAIFRMPVDSIPMGMQRPDWVKPGTHQMLNYSVVLTSVKSQDEMIKEREAASAKQKGVDDKLIQDYLSKNKIKATKTESGLYYTISTPGSGEQAHAGQTVTVNYTGKTLDGKTFDSNVDPTFNHVQPFSFGLGQHQVIPGWDEGVALLKKGSKATLFIPSTLAYGPNGQGPIKPNSILMFDVEVTDIKAPTPPPAPSAPGKN